jgi:hypothetical protein
MGRTARSHNGCYCPRNVKMNSDEQHAMFSHELQSALILKVEFSKMYYKLTNLSLEHKY